MQSGESVLNRAHLIAGLWKAAKQRLQSTSNHEQGRPSGGVEECLSQPRTRLNAEKALCFKERELRKVRI
jgi:hypothetical protein